MVVVFHPNTDHIFTPARQALCLSPIKALTVRLARTAYGLLQQYPGHTADCPPTLHFASVSSLLAMNLVELPVVWPIPAHSCNQAAEQQD